MNLTVTLLSPPLRPSFFAYAPVGLVLSATPLVGIFLYLVFEVANLDAEADVSVPAALLGSLATLAVLAWGLRGAANSVLLCALAEMDAGVAAKDMHAPDELKKAVLEYRHGKSSQWKID